MRVATTDDGWALEAIGDLEWMFLERLPGMAAGEDLPTEQKRRILPDPIAADALPDNEEAQELRSDWDEFVKPELSLAFADARERVAKDLTAMTESTADSFVSDDDDEEEDDDEAGTGVPSDPDESYFRLEVPGEHSELWYNTLNQARLLMNEVYDLANSEQSLFEQMLQRQMAEEEGADESEDEKNDAAAPEGMLLMLLAQYQFYLPRSQAFGPPPPLYELNLGGLQTNTEIIDVDRSARPPTALLDLDDAAFGGEVREAVLATTPLIDGAYTDPGIASTDAEYVEVQFRYVPPNERQVAGPVELIGTFSGWQPEIELAWTPEVRRYEGTALLKQGLYVYGYALPGRVQGRVLSLGQPSLFTAFVYLRDSQLFTDRLVAIQSGIAR